MKTILRGGVLLAKIFAKAYLTILAFFLALFSIVALVALGEENVQSFTVDTATSVVEFSHVAGTKSARKKVVIFPIQGVILSEKSSDPLSSWLETHVTYGNEMKQTLEALALETDVVGVILTVDSPGGTVVGSKAIYDAVNAYQAKTGNPVYAYVGGTSASGAYWASMAADKIVADTGTMIGSIGVILGPFKFFDGVIAEDSGAFTGGVVTQNGVQTTYITAGTSKDIGNPYRQITDQERLILQQGANDAYNVFVDEVAKSRRLSPDVIKTEIGAMIYGEQQAGRLGLIDAVGSREAVQRDLLDTLALADSDVEFITPNSQLSFVDQLMAKVPQASSKEPLSGCPLSHAVMAYSADLNGLCH